MPETHRLETPWQTSIGLALLLALFLAISLGQSAAQAARSDPLHRVANPMANLSTAAFLHSQPEGLAAGSGQQDTLGNQPVIPFSRNGNWRVIFRTVIPFVSFGGVPSGTGKTSGIGKIVLSVFLLPKQPTAGELVWDVEPVFQLPTPTVDRLDPEQLGAGVAAVALFQNRSWTCGTVASHIRSGAGQLNPITEGWNDVVRPCRLLAEVPARMWTLADAVPIE